MIAGPVPAPLSPSGSPTHVSVPPNTFLPQEFAGLATAIWMCNREMVNDIVTYRVQLELSQITGCRFLLDHALGRVLVGGPTEEHVHSAIFKLENLRTNCVSTVILIAGAFSLTF